MLTTATLSFKTDFLPKLQNSDIYTLDTRTHVWTLVNLDLIAVVVGRSLMASTHTTQVGQPSVGEERRGRCILKFILRRSKLVVVILLNLQQAVDCFHFNLLFSHSCPLRPC